MNDGSPGVQQTGAAKLALLYLGMANQLSTLTLEQLLAAGLQICAVVVPGLPRQATSPIRRVLPERRSPLPLLNPYLEPGPMQLAWERDIPVFELSRPGDPASLETLAELRPDVGCVACFSLRLPERLLQLPRLGFLNLHPSLLPAYRGPAPLFWTLQQAEPAPGVTVHVMDAGLDTGPILLQAPVTLPDGISGLEVEQRCAALGSRLLVEALRALQDGRLQSRPQPQGGSYHPWPTADDFRLSTSWPARRAFNFMRGTAEWGQPYLLELAGEQLLLAEALAYDPGGELGTAFQHTGDSLQIQFTPGTLLARRA